MDRTSLQYVDTALNGYKSRNNPKSITWLINYFQTIKLGQSTNLANVFIGQYKYNDSLIDFIKKNQTISGFESPHVSDFILTDTDEKRSVLDSIPKIKNLLDHLETFGLVLFENLEIRTTGHKGFNLVIPAGTIAYEPLDNFSDVVYRFVELLFPDEGKTKGWLNWYRSEDTTQAKDANHLKHVDSSIYEKSRLCRLPCTKNAPKTETEDDGQPYGYCIYLNKTEVDEIFKNPESLFEIWSKPNGRGVDKSYLSGDHFWQYKPVPKLQELWEQAISLAKNKPKYHTAFENKNTSYNPLGAFAPKCIKKIWEIVNNGGYGVDKSGNRIDLLEGRCNETFAAVLPWLYKAFPDIGFVSAAIRHLNGKLSQPMPESAINSMLEAHHRNHYGFSCGMDTPKGRLLQSFCGGTCAKNKRTWVYGYEAYDKMNRFWSQGDSPVTLGIEFWDDIFHGHLPGQVVCFQSFPGVGKTSFLGRIFRHQIPKAKAMNKLCYFSTPEENHEIIQTYLAMQQGEMTLSRLKQEIKEYGQANGKIHEFNESYGQDYIIDYLRGKTPKDIRNNLLAIQQSSGKGFFSVHIDSSTFIKPDNDNLSGSSRAESVANALEDIAAEFDTVLFISIHLPKFEGYSKFSKKHKIRLTDNRPSLIGAKGTVDWAGLVSHLNSIYTRGDKVVMFAPEKGRLREDGQMLPHPQPFLRSGHYMLYSLEEAKQLYGEQVDQVFGVDSYELNQIAKYGDHEVEKEQVS